MKRIYLPVVLAITLTGGFALAQASDPAAVATPPQRHHQANPHRETMRMSKKLNLSSDQIAKLEPILADRDQKISAIRENTALSAQDRKAQMRTIHRGTEQQLESVMTPEQVQQMKAMHKGHHGPEETPPTPPPAAS